VVSDDRKCIDDGNTKSHGSCRCINNSHSRPRRPWGIHEHQFIITTNSGWRSCCSCRNDRKVKNRVQSARTLQYCWLCNGVYFPIECVPSLSCKCDGKEKTWGRKRYKKFLCWAGFSYLILHRHSLVLVVVDWASSGSKRSLCLFDLKSNGWYYSLGGSASVQVTPPCNGAATRKTNNGRSDFFAKSKSIVFQDMS
jgi:hypothetical protein